MMALATGGVLAGILCIGLLLFLSGEPKVKGRTVEKWMMCAAAWVPATKTVFLIQGVAVTGTVNAVTMYDSERQSREAIDVLRELAAKAEPAMVRGLKAQDTRWGLLYEKLWWKAPVFLKRNLKSPIPALAQRQNTLKVIGKVGRLSPTLEAALREACNDPDQIVQERAAAILGYRGSCSPETLRVFEETMARKKARDDAMIASNQTKRIIVRQRRLGDEFDFTPTTVEQMTQDLDRPYYEARYAAANALQNLGPTAAPAVPALIRNLSDAHDIVRNASIRALGCIGPAASNALPALRAFLNHESQFTVSATKEAIQRIESAAWISKGPTNTTPARSH